MRTTPYSRPWRPNGIKQPDPMVAVHGKPLLEGMRRVSTVTSHAPRRIVQRKHLYLWGTCMPLCIGLPCSLHYPRQLDIAKFSRDILQSGSSTPAGQAACKSASDLCRGAPCIMVQIQMKKGTLSLHGWGKYIRVMIRADLRSCQMALGAR